MHYTFARKEASHELGKNLYLVKISSLMICSLLYKRDVNHNLIIM